MLQKITIPNKRGELVGLLHDTGSTELVIVCHGYQSTKEGETVVNIAVALEKQGISAFRFDFHGCGESGGVAQKDDYYIEAEDLRSVVEYFSRNKHMPAAIVGHSKGGNVVLLYASKYHDIDIVVSISACYDLKRVIEERLGEKDGYIDVKSGKGVVDYRATKESVMNTMHDPCVSIDRRCRVLIVHGSADEVIPVEDAFEFAKVIPTNQLKIIEGADHNYSAYQVELASLVLGFIKECLQSGKDISI